MLLHQYSTQSVARETGWSLRHVRRLAELHGIPHFTIHSDGMMGNRLFLYTPASLEVFRRLRREYLEARAK